MFEKVFVISYINNFEKRKNITEKLNDLNIEFDFMYGSNLYDIKTFRHIKQYGTDEPRSDYFIHNVSGSLTHLNAVEYAYNGGYNNVLIMEDDICFIDNYDFIFHCLNNYPEDADLIQYGYISFPQDLPKSKVYHDKTFALHSYLPGAQMYGLCNRKVMKDYIDSQHNNYASADNIYIFKNDKKNKYKKYVVYPQVAIDSFWHKEYLKDDFYKWGYK